MCVLNSAQDMHHYASGNLVHKPVSVVTDRDRRKKEIAREKGITLIAVPCWWNGSTDR